MPAKIALFTVAQMTADILPLTPEEIPALLEMIRELAEFEKLEHEMQATAESLHESFFGTVTLQPER